MSLCQIKHDFATNKQKKKRMEKEKEEEMLRKIHGKRKCIWWTQKKQPTTWMFVFANKFDHIYTMRKKRTAATLYCHLI